MQLPGPVRAYVGLLAVTVDEARRLPDRVIEVPMTALSTVLQLSLRAQQRYTALAARGDDVLHRRPPSQEAPPWARFDDDVPPPASTPRPASAFDTAFDPVDPVGTTDPSDPIDLIDSSDPVGTIEPTETPDVPSLLRPEDDGRFDDVRFDDGRAIGYRGAGSGSEPPAGN